MSTPSMADALAGLFHAVGRVLEAAGELPSAGGFDVAALASAMNTPATASNVPDGPPPVFIPAAVAVAAPAAAAVAAPEEEALPPEPEEVAPVAAKPARVSRKQVDKAPLAPVGDNTVLSKVDSATPYAPGKAYGMIIDALPGTFGKAEIIATVTTLKEQGTLVHKYGPDRVASTFLGHAMRRGNITVVGESAPAPKRRRRRKKVEA